MTKPSLSICERDAQGRHQTLGMKEIIGYLVDSGEFEVTYHKDIVNHPKGIRGIIVYYNDKKILIDFWEYGTPAYTGEALGHNFDLIIKLQHRAWTSLHHFHRACQRKNVFMGLTPEDREAYLAKFVPWTFFPSRIMLPFVDKENDFEPLPIERLAFFCGKGWKSRSSMVKKLQDEGIEWVQSSQERVRKGRPLTDEQYINYMRTSKFGLVLHGRCSMFTEPKNRREIDYMMLKKPLLLNYKPFYYNSLEEGKHYIYINENTALKNLENEYNINDIAQNGYQWYKDNASPKGVVSTFKQIMKDRFDDTGNQE